MQGSISGLLHCRRILYHMNREAFKCTHIYIYIFKFAYKHMEGAQSLWAKAVKAN